MIIPANELNLAVHMVRGFSSGCGETDVEYLSACFGVNEETLTQWAREEGYLYGDDGLVSMSVMPRLWADFAEESRVCLALHTALQELLKAGAGPPRRKMAPGV